ncbi:hypothetical protein FBU30_007343 [Linnemannia zychae]|nr:hypothetical protein FBU30_007343 [Linnemannia zychae]
MSSEKTTPSASASGCLDIFKGLFAAKPSSSAEEFNEKNAHLYNDQSSSTTSLPPAYQSLSQEMSQLLVNESSKVPLSDLWEKDEFAKTVHLAIEDVSSELRAISLKLHENPELGYEEYKAHILLTDYLETKGFQVERKAYGMDTAFVARAGNSDKVTIGICSEYDALPSSDSPNGAFHACGHNLIAISGVATAIGLKVVIEKFGLEGEVKLFGTPAEETTGGKIVMLDNGAFKDVDVCMMLHGANTDVIYPAFLALDTCEVEYFGKATHASASPWEGINALDAAIQTYTNLAMMRQQLQPSHRVHGIIKDGGKAANIIPDYTKSVYTVRAPKWAEVEVLKKRVEKIFQASATSTGCTVKLTWGIPYKGKSLNYIITNEPLTHKFEYYMNNQGLKYKSKQEQMSKVSGSTDMGNLTHALPGIHPMFNILNLVGEEDLSAGMHTKEFAYAAAQPIGHTATLRAAKSLALTGLECIVDSIFLKAVKQAYDSRV